MQYPSLTFCLLNKAVPSPNIDSPFAKMCSCVPILGIYIGVKRIADAIFSINETTTSNKITRVFKIIRGLIEISGTGIILVPIDLFLCTLRASTENKTSHSISKSKSPPAKILSPSFLPSRKILTDLEIIKNLQRQGFDEPQEQGGGGRCLFLSIAPQVREEDLQQASKGISFKKWKTHSSIEQADILRSWAMENEERFINGLPCSYSDLDDLDRFWIKELYKDMVQELMHLPPEQVFDLTKRINEDDCFKYVKDQFNSYQTNTARPTNWAGSSEAISLSRLFNREIQMFGHDKATSKELNLDDQGNVLPYCQYLGRSPAIHIFQCNGGGHYRSLISKKIQKPSNG